MNPTKRTLADLRPGARAVIDGLELPGPVGRRLTDLGFLPGTPVEVLRRAPLGDPSVYALRGVQFCLRRREALGVRVREDG